MTSLLSIAMREAGVAEAQGSLSNERILQYAEEAGFQNYQSDDVAWCSLFMNWVAKEAGYERTNSLAARSWLHKGQQVSTPQPGDVVIFWRESVNSWKGHVGLFVGYSKDLRRIYCLGGNQNDQVSISGYHTDRLLGFRRLRPIETRKLNTIGLSSGNTGTEVRVLQEALNILGFEAGAVDGIFGPKTKTALELYQASVNIQPTGVLDEQTLNSINEHLE